jgi:hypothetical protein
MKELHKYGLIESLDFDSFDRCSYGQDDQNPFKGFVERATNLSGTGIIHIDVCGPMSVSALNGYIYFVIFTIDLKSSKSFRVRLKINLTRK